MKLELPCNEDILYHAQQMTSLACQAIQLEHHNTVNLAAFAPIQ